jgi:hypothetical protein
MGRLIQSRLANGSDLHRDGRFRPLSGPLAHNLVGCQLPQIQNPYTILITGSRKWKDTGVIRKLIISAQSKHPNRKVKFIFGDCKGGADQIAYGFCLAYNASYVRFQAHWDKFGKKAGPIRNQEMVEYQPDEAYAFREPGALNTGTDGCIDLCIKHGIKVTIIGEQRRAGGPNA